MRFPSIRRAALLGSALAALALPAAANAAITATAVSSPADQTSFLYNNDLGSNNASNKFRVTGTSTGATLGDRVNIRCFYGAGSGDYNTLATNVPVSEAGAFSVLVPMNNPSGSDCLVRAVPAGGTFDPSSASDRAAFAGPEIYVGNFGTNTSSNQVVDYYLDLYGKYGRTYTYSPSSDALTGQSLRDRTNPWVAFGTGLLDNAGTAWDDTFTPTVPAAAPSQPYIRVDGVRARMSYNSDADKFGFMEMAVDMSRNSATGTTTVHEVSPLFRCEPEIACDKYVSLGVSWDRTTTVDGSGTLVTYLDKFVNTAGGSHTVDLRMLEDADNNTGSVHYKFGNDALWSTKTAGDLVSLPAGSSSALVTDTTTLDSDDSANKPVSFMAWASPVAVSAYFQNSTELHRPIVATIAPGAAYEVKSAYGTAPNLASANSMRVAAEDKLVAPSVAFSGPTSGAQVANGSTVVTGTATDNVGVTSVTVNGVAASLSAGKWSVSLPVSGATKFTATAKDAAGNAASAELSVTGLDKAAPIVTVAKLPKFFSLATVLKSGLPFTFTTTEPGKASIKATVPAKLFNGIGKVKGKAGKKPSMVVIGQSKVVTVTQAGKVKLTLVLNKAAKKRLAKLRKTVKFTVTFTMVDTAGNTTTKTSTATIKYVKPKKKK